MGMKPKLVPASTPTFLLDRLDPEGKGLAVFSREALEDFLKEFVPDIKEHGMRDNHTVGVRFTALEMEIALGEGALTEGEVRFSSALRMALIWKLGVIHGQQQK